MNTLSSGNGIKNKFELDFLLKYANCPDDLEG